MIHVQLQEMDERVTFQEQLQQDSGPVVLINRFNVAPGDTELLLHAWADDAAFMKQQPGYISEPVAQRPWLVGARASPAADLGGGGLGPRRRWRSAVSG